MIWNPLITFVDARAEIEKFERALAAYEIRISPGSDLELVALIVSEMEDVRSGRTPMDVSQDPRPIFRKAVGLLEFVTMLNRQYTLTGLAAFIRHLELLNKAKSVAPGVRTLRDEAANKLFELYWAMVCLKVGSDMKLDPPNRAKGDNPDILVTIAGRRLGFACKVIEGQNPLSWYERVEDGLGQIDSSLEAQIGCVVLNPSALVNHDIMWPLLNPGYRQQEEAPALGWWANEYAVADLLRQTATNLNRRFVEKNSREKVEGAFRLSGRKSLPLTLSVMQTVCQIAVGDQCPVSTVAFLSASPVDPISDPDQNVLHRLNHSLQSRFERSTD